VNQADACGVPSTLGSQVGEQLISALGGVVQELVGCDRVHRDPFRP
jgi:hypothetical protein